MQEYNREKTSLRDLQLRMLDMLKFIDDICKKNNISYWLSSGTLLGAIRHKGFIPWDDDCDIEMLREDYDKLIKILKNDPNGKYVIQTTETDRDYLYPFAKLRDLSTILVCDENIYDSNKYRGAFIDIFPLESYPFWILRFCAGIQYKILFPLYAFLKGNKAAQVLKYFVVNFLFPLIRFLSKKKRDYYTHTLGVPFYLKRRYKMDIYPLISIEFENYNFPSPNDYDSYLKNLYGNYNKIPPINERHTHNFNNIIFIK